MFILKTMQVFHYINLFYVHVDMFIHFMRNTLQYQD